MTSNAAGNVVLVVGTRKGLFIFRSDERRRDWQLSGPFLTGNEINHATIDQRSGVLYATANDAWFGNRVMSSTDLGETWTEGTTAPRFGEDSGKTVERLWHIEPGRAAETGVLYCGVDPAHCSAARTAVCPGSRMPASMSIRPATAGRPAPAASSSTPSSGPGRASAHVGGNLRRRSLSHR
jgi:hypothetical protein